MKRLLIALVLAVLAACGTVQPRNQLETAYSTVGAYVDMTTISLQRGRITPDQAAKASANAKKARDAIDQARTALAICKPELPCTDYVSILQNLQPTLYEMEREMRAQQGAAR